MEFSEYLQGIRNCVNNKYFVMLSSQKDFMHHLFSSTVYIHGNVNAGHARCREHELPYHI